MIIVMKFGSPTDEIEKVSEEICRWNITQENRLGNHKVVIGLVGDTADIDPIQIQNLSPFIEQVITVTIPDCKSIFPKCSKLNKIFQFIEDNYRQPINLHNVAQAVGYSPAYLTNLVKRQTSRTVYCWIVERRMEEARSLLIETDQPVNRIAAQVGYSDPGHFTRLFRRIHKMPPQAWRNNHCKQFNTSQNW